MANQLTITAEESMPDVSISTTIVEAVATEAGVDPTWLPPLYEQIDPDALDTLFDPTTVSKSGPIELQFTYANYVVTVSYDDDEPTVTVDEQRTT